MSGEAPVPTSTLDWVVSHIPAAAPAKLLWAILEPNKMPGKSSKQPWQALDKSLPGVTAGQVGKQEKSLLPEPRV